MLNIVQADHKNIESAFTIYKLTNFNKLSFFTF